MVEERSPEMSAGAVWSWAIIACAIFGEFIWAFLLGSIWPEVDDPNSMLLGAVVLAMFAMLGLVAFLALMIIPFIYLKSLAARIFSSLVVTSLIVEIVLTVNLVQAIG